MGANLLIVVASAALLHSQQDTTRSTHGFALERLPDLFQYNRVQGLSFGVGYRVRIPGSRFADLYGTVRYGLSDERVTGRLTVVRDGPDGRIALSGYTDIADLDPFSPGRTFANTFNGLIAAHDNADYALARGGSISYGTSVAGRLDLVLAARIERQASVGRAAQSELNDLLGGSGLFPPNPAVDEGTFGAVSAGVSHIGRARWKVTAEVLGGSGRTTGRLFGDVRRSVDAGIGVTLRVKAGISTEPSFAQSLFRLGGLNTVRGFDYGTLRAPAFWAGQLDITPFEGRVGPVVFLDAGQASRLADLFSSPALVGGGAGLSLFSGLLRFDLSRPISPDRRGKVRFDIVIQGAR